MKLILKVQEVMNNLIHKEDGVTAIEYGLIAAATAVAIIAALALIEPRLADVFDRIAGALL